MFKPFVLIAEPLAAEPLAWLENRCRVVGLGVEDPGFGEALEQADAMVVRTYTIVDQQLLDRAPNLKVVGRAGVGLDNIDLNACAAHGVRVVHTPHANAMGVVEYMISMLITTMRPIESMSRPLNQERWQEQWHRLRHHAITPGSVVGTSIGIIGLGYIGSRLAAAATALGMDVRYTDLRRIDSSHAQSQSLADLLAESRCVCLHVDGRAENQGLIGDAEFATMRDDVIFFNASRGFVVDSDAAVRFAKANPNATLVLDVHDPEPIDHDSPLFGLDNIILTPHIAAATHQAKTAMSWVVRDVWAVLAGQEPSHPVD